MHHAPFQQSPASKRHTGTAQVNVNGPKADEAWMALKKATNTQNQDGDGASQIVGGLVMSPCHGLTLSRKEVKEVL